MLVLSRPSQLAPDHPSLPARAGAVLWLALLGLAPCGAWACRPDFHMHDDPVQVYGPDGAVAWLYGDWYEASVGPAQDLGRGFIQQELLDGHWCSGEASTLIHDCTTGEAVIFGGAFDRMIPQTYEPAAVLGELIAERVRAGQLMSITEIRDEAVARDLGFVMLLRTTSTLRLGAYEFELGQACRLHYLDLSGADQ